MESTYFTSRLTTLLVEDHPDLIVTMGEEVESFIEARGDSAAQVFASEVKTGTPQDMALEKALEVLREGLNFSKYNTIEDILLEYYPEKLQPLSNDRERREYIINLVQKCEGVFSSYDLNVYNDKLQTELIGTIGLEYGI